MTVKFYKLTAGIICSKSKESLSCLQLHFLQGSPLEPWGLGSWACPWLSWMDTHTHMHTCSPRTHVCLGFPRRTPDLLREPELPLPSLVWLSYWPQLLAGSHQHPGGTCARSGPSQLKTGNLPWSPPAPPNLPALFGLPLKAASCARLPMGCPWCPFTGSARCREKPGMGRTQSRRCPLCIQCPLCEPVCIQCPLCEKLSLGCGRLQVLSLSSMVLT